MDSPDTHIAPLEDSEPQAAPSLFDVMAATQRFLAQNMVDIATQAAQEETNLAHAKEIAEHSKAQEAAAILAAQEHKFKAEHFRTHDSLTGLPNKVYLTETLEKQLAKNRTVGVFSIDIVGFKTEINDKLGHPTGDRFLINWANYANVAFSRVSDVIAAEPEDSDHQRSIARTGGDEFYVLSNLGADSADRPNRRADSIEGQAKHEYEYIHQVFKEFVASSEWSGSKLAVSVGFALRQPDEAVTAEELIAIADARMYDEKQDQHSTLGIKR